MVHLPHKIKSGKVCINPAWNKMGDICDLTERMSFESVFITVLYSLAFVVGILGNGLLLGVLFQSRKTWSVTDTFILHLGIADNLMLVTLPLWAAQSANEKGWTFDNSLCKISGTINVYCRIFLLACISLDRYLSIVHATQMYTRRKAWVVQASCLMVWLLSMLLSIPDWIFLEVVTDVRQKRDECVCNYYKFGLQYSSTLKLAARGLYHAVGFLLPSAVLVFCYSCILWQLWCGTQGLQKQRAFKVIIAVVAVFFICWTPYNITLMVDTVQQDDGSTSCEMNTSLDYIYFLCRLPVLYEEQGRVQQFYLLRGM
ncbi:C-X-C chemokine receptor type 3-like [Nematolebias whitei]|uniref:C-X-C chemokine receptor type 3-like n=1 Tax=Nematolebias whitei TaxID=451745 RepID=UPI00189A51AE|nr:C-X-C chemokine receptor type 3-like [Nematolebias whitei]